MPGILFPSPYKSVFKLIQPSVSPTSVGVTETVLGTITIPGGALGTTGMLRISGVALVTSSATTKSMRVRLNGLTGTALLSLGGVTTNANWEFYGILNANASQSSQYTFGFTRRTGDTIQLGVTPVLSTIDMSANVDIVLTGQMTSGSENMACLALIAELVR